MDNRIVREWMRFADIDLDAAELLLAHRPQNYGIICYHCQQAAEKYLKGYLISCSMEAEDAPKTHNLTQLCVLCADKDDRFVEIMKLCASLTPYAIQPRYPDEIYIDEALMKKALACAQQIKAFAPLRELREKLSEEN